ncbi:MAG: NADH-quinone oxidoreductase subunit J, partial [Aliifodinibius sp.]|nr:NADH-quinone oxidoreductase subunit J [Fodinibius sp.]
MQILFYIAAVIAIFSTVMVITRLNAVHALLYLIVSLLSVAVIFFI